MRNDFAARIQRDAVAVENQFVVRADQVDLRQRNFFVARDAARAFPAAVRSLPSCHGEAEMLRMISAPCAISSLTGSRR